MQKCSVDGAIRKVWSIVRAISSEGEIMYKKPRHDPVFGESSANRAQADKFLDSLRAMLDSYEDPVCDPRDEQSHKARQYEKARETEI